MRPPPALVGLAAALLLGAACNQAPTDPVAERDEAAAATSPAPSPTPEPPAPVEGTVVYEGVRLDTSGALLHPRGSAGDVRPTLDEPAMRAAIGRVAGLLDAHLTALQAGTTTALPGGLDGAVAPAAARAATTDLTSPAAPVDAAVHDLRVGVDTTARWIHATTTVTRRDGSVRAADFVFALGDAGPVLVAAGPASGGPA